MNVWEFLNRLVRGGEWKGTTAPPPPWAADIVYWVFSRKIDAAVRGAGVETSGRRSEGRNVAVGGVHDSLHLYGAAQDRVFPGTTTHAELVRIAEEAEKRLGLDSRAIIYGSRHVHFQATREWAWHTLFLIVGGSTALLLLLIILIFGAQYVRK